MEIWNLAMSLYRRILPIVELLRVRKEYRMAEQIKSAAGSIMDNIAEGFEKGGRLEFLQSLSVAKGECGELRSQLYRCKMDSVVSQQEFDCFYEELDKITRKIANFIKYINTTSYKGLKFKDRVDIR